MPNPTHDRMNEIADFLDEKGRPDYAEDVRELLEPGGWTRLRESVGTYTTNVPLTMHVGLRDAIKAAATSKGKTLSNLVTKGYREVLDGVWTPPAPARATSLKGRRVVLNVTVDDSLRKDLRGRLDGLKEELGYDRKLTESWVAISVLRHKLDVSDEDIQAFGRVAELSKPAE